MGKLTVTIGIGNQQGAQFEDLEVDGRHRLDLHRGSQGAAGEARSTRIPHGPSPARPRGAPCPWTSAGRWSGSKARSSPRR